MKLKKFPVIFSFLTKKEYEFNLLFLSKTEFENEWNSIETFIISNVFRMSGYRINDDIRSRQD